MKTIKTSKLKIAAPIIDIKEWRYGPVLVITGNTFPIKDRLKILGFKPYRLGQSWVQVMDIKTFKSKSQEEQKRIFLELNSMGIQNTKILNVEQKSNEPTPPISQPTPKIEKEILQGEEYPYRSSIGKDRENRTREKYSFPIAKNILEVNINVKIGDEVKTEKAQISRSFMPGKTSDTYKVTFDKDYRDFPIYEFDIGKKENGSPILKLRIGTKGKTTQYPWGTYNEREYLTQTLVPRIEDIITKRNQYQQAFIDVYDKKQRDQELETFLQKIKYSWDNENVLFDLKITEGPYIGSYPVNIYYWEPQEIVLETALKHPLAPRKTTLTRIDLVGIHNINELNSSVIKALAEPKSIKNYVEYLSSFPFLGDQLEEETKKFENIRYFIKNKSIDVESVLQKIKEMGYIRPHKRQKSMGPGMTSGDEIKWVLDSEAIRNGIYSRGFEKSSPDFFYTVVAYYVMKAKTGQWSWTDIMLVDSIRDWINIMKKFGEELDFKEISETISAIGKEILYMVFGQKSQTRREKYYNFYYGGGFFGNDEGSGFGQSSNSSTIELENYSRKLGLDPTGLTPKRLYRQLTRVTHPDVNRNDPSAEENFKELGRIWDAIPEELKQACNWYEKITIG